MFFFVIHTREYPFIFMNGLFTSFITRFCLNSLFSEKYFTDVLIARRDKDHLEHLEILEKSNHSQ